MTLFLFSSCATILLRKEYKVSVSTDLPNAKAEIRDSIYYLPADVTLRRSRKDLLIKLLSDSLIKVYQVKASPNATFLYCNLICYPILPLMYGVDLTNQKRFYYGKSIYLDSNDALGVIRPPVSKKYYDYWKNTYPTQKGQLNLLVSFPWVNNFFLHPYQESIKVNTGFWGISTGLEYYYNENKYIALTGSAVMDFFIPFPAAVDFSGEVESMYSVYTSITDNYKFRRFTVGYGLNYSKNFWRLAYFDSFDPPPPTREPAQKTSYSIGLTLDGYHQIGKNFFLGLCYRPTFLTINPEIALKYEHLISLDFRWKFRITK